MQRMIRLPLGSLAVLIALCGAGQPLQAQIVTFGNLFEVVNGNGIDVGSTVDYWYFTTNSAGNVTIDTLSWEVDSADRLDDDGDALETFDLNADGEIAFVDTYIYLFHDDGSLDAGDAIASNDDTEDTFDDGSLSGLDAYLSVFLTSGDYLLVVGAFHFTGTEAITRTNDELFYPTTADGAGNYIQTDHGDYQITWTGDLTITGDPGTGVPEPSSAVAALAWMLVVAWKRR